MISMATVVRILSAPTRQKRMFFSEIRQHNSVAPTREKILFHFLKKRRGDEEREGKGATWENCSLARPTLSASQCHCKVVVASDSPFLLRTCNFLLLVAKKGCPKTVFLFAPSR